jgi:hypothetical protein
VVSLQSPCGRDEHLFLDPLIPIHDREYF